MQKLKTNIITMFFVVAAAVAAQAQDIIFTVKAEKIEAKIIEVDIHVVRYKQYDYQDGPVYVIKKSDIDSIVFQNGRVSVFEKIQEEASVDTTNKSNAMTYAAFSDMDDDEMAAFLQTNDSKNYEIFQQGERNARMGKSLFIPGIAITGVGAATIMVGGAFWLFTWGMAQDMMIQAAIVGGVIIAIAQPFVIASIVLRAQGGALKATAKNNYADKVFKNTTSLNFNLCPNGFGMTLHF